MRTRRLDNQHDWTFGQGFSNYETQSEAIAQNVQTRLWSFLGDWFLDLEHGLPWFEQMGRSVNLNDWEIKIKRYVLETEGVMKITDYVAEVDTDSRHLTIRIVYQDIYGTNHEASYQGSPFA